MLGIFGSPQQATGPGMGRSTRCARRVRISGVATPPRTQTALGNTGCLDSAFEPIEPTKSGSDIPKGATGLADADVDRG